MESKEDYQKLNSLNDLIASKDEFQRVQKNKQIQQQDEKVQDPKLAAIYMTLMILGQAGNWLCIKYLYIRVKPALNGFQILFVRAIFCTLITYVYVNKDLKKAMYDSVPRDQAGNLVSRCVQGLIIKALQYELMKYFKLTTISLIANMSPLLTLILGYLILKENVNKYDIIQVLGSIAAIILIFFSMLEDRKQLDSQKIQDDKLIQEDSAEYARRDHFTVIIFILLLSMPAGIAFQNILLRKMRKMNENTISCYINPFHMICCFIALVCTGSDYINFILKILKNDWISLGMFAFLGGSTVIQQILKFKAHQHQEASKLAVFVYLEVGIQYLFDLLIIDAHLNLFFYVGLAMMIIVYILKYMDIMKQAKKLEDEKQQEKEQLLFYEKEQTKNAIN